MKKGKHILNQEEIIENQKILKKCLADGPEVAAQEYNQKVKKVV